MQVIFTVVFGIFEMFQGDWYSGLDFTRSKRLFVMALAALHQFGAMFLWLSGRALC